ncbi:MAG: hypothetical protein ACXVCY_12280 [Pseudobdellovibrionaceae bacterium]
MKHLIYFLFILSSSLSWGQTISNQLYLTKLSKALKGTVPTLAERQELDAAESAHTDNSYLLGKISEYTRTAYFQFKMKTLIDEHFRVNASVKPLDIPSPYNFNYAAKSSYDYLVEKIIATNMSWDSLLLAKSYTYDFFKYPYYYSTDKDFYKNILNSKDHWDMEADLQQAPNSIPIILKESVDFDPQDPRIAGVLTTSRFLNRYQNTALNKNRRRAAAVFRSFLCDSMVAAIPAKTTDSEKTDFDVLLPASSLGSSDASAKTDIKTEEQLRRELRKNDPHGTLPGCMACHYKLDPLGKTFGLSAVGLSDKTSPGALIYKNNNHSVNIPVSGVGELAEKIVQQKEYVDCQVNLFWKWFIGQDVPQTTVRHNQLITQFENSGRRPIDFISYLVQTPEFKIRPVLLTENQILARKASKVLKRCYDCHKDQDINLQMKSWDMTDFPYSDKTEINDGLLKQINQALDLEGDGASRRMPPPESLWQPSPEELTILKTWIANGAPDYTGKRQVQ